MCIHKTLLYSTIHDINDISKIILEFPERYSHFKDKNKNAWQLVTVKQITNDHFVIVLNDPDFEKPRGKYKDNILIHVFLLTEKSSVLIKIFLKWPVWKRNLIIIQDLLAFIFLSLPVCLDIKGLSLIVFIIFPIYVIFYHLTNFLHNKKTLRVITEIFRRQSGIDETGDGSVS